MEDYTPSRAAREEHETSEAIHNDSLDAQSKPMKTYTFYYTLYKQSMGYNYKIHEGTDQDAPVLYYVYKSYFTRRTPDVQLLSGDDKKTIVAFSKISDFGRKNVIGYGDPTSMPAKDIVFEELKRESWWTNKTYTFEALDADGVRRKYTWKRRYHNNLLRRYTCVDTDSGAEVAHFTGSYSLKQLNKLGQMKVMLDASEHFCQSLFVSWSTIREKEDRERWGHSGGGTGGS